MRPLDIVASGAVTNLGLSRDASAAAFRAQIDNFTETRFMDSNGEWLIAGEIPLDRHVRGRAKLLELLTLALTECHAQIDAGPGAQAREIPILLCIAGAERVGRIISDGAAFFSELQGRISVPFSRDSRVIAQEKAGITTALDIAESLLYDRAYDHVLIAAVDSLLTARTLRSYDANSLLLSRTTSNGFIPGEGAACLAVSRAGDHHKSPTLRVLGHGVGHQRRSDSSDVPISADGMIAAIVDALRSANLTLSQISAWFYDNDVSYLPVKEATLAELRLLRGENITLARQGLSGQLGETGSPSVLLMLVFFAATAPAGVIGLVTASSENDHRVALLVQYVTSGR